MHVGKKTLSALMALTLTASLAACSASTPADTTHAATPSENLVQTSSTPSVDEEGAKRTEYPLTITTYNYNKEPVEYTFEKAPERVYAYAQDNIEILLSLGLADRIVAFEEGIPQADLVVLATPVDTIPLMAVKALNRVNGSQVVMDLGSIKAELCEVISMHARRGRFVAAHPMWGTEYSGPRAAQHGAFTGRNVVLCEVERSDPDALAMAERIFRTLEAPAVYMDAEEHDLHAAYVSHISHITSFALALTVLEKEREERHIFDLAGGGFESTVRLAKSSAATWVPIMLHNKYNLLDVLREHIHQLQIMRRMIERDDAEGLKAAFDRANSIQRIIH